MLTERRHADVICGECSHFVHEHGEAICHATIRVASHDHPCHCAGFVSLTDALAAPA